MNKLVIISRYNEDITWAENLEADVIVYNKGEDFPYDYPKIDIPNFGREAETYVRSILEFYDFFDRYESVSFMQANPFDHCNNPVEMINNADNKNILHIATSSVKQHLHGQEIFGKNIQVINKLFDVDIQLDLTYSDFKNNVTENEPSRIMEYVHNIFMYEILGLKYNDKTFYWAAGSQYLVPVKYIKNKSLGWWYQLYSLFQHWEKHITVCDIAGPMERTWPLIWDHEAHE